MLPKRERHGEVDVNGPVQNLKTDQGQILRVD
jgi:hypothetical protein